MLLSDGDGVVAVVAVVDRFFALNSAHDIFLIVGGFK